jgi:hypothetical protein
MREFIAWYISVGCAIYLLYAVRDGVGGFKRFKKADYHSIIRGWFGGVFLWPLILWISDIKTEHKKDLGDLL